MNLIKALRGAGFKPVVLDNPDNMDKQLEGLTIQADSYEPDYEGRCMSCGSVPVVTVWKDGACIHNVELCGPCTWGDGDMADPAKWNE